MIYVIGVLIAVAITTIAVRVRNYYLSGSMDNDKFRKRAAGIYAGFSVFFNIAVLIVWLAGLSTLLLIWFITFPTWVLYFLVSIFVLFILSTGFAYFAFTVPHNKRPELIGLHYEKNGRLRHWSRATHDFRKKIGWTERFVDQAVQVFEKMAHGSSDPFHILSPSANDGKCELMLTKRAATVLNKKICMYASDVAKIDQDETSNSDELVEFHYTSGVSADQLKTTYSSLKFDAIFDLKGVLWHQINSLNKKSNAHEIMSTYYDLLKPNGILIVEGYTQNYFKTWFASFQLQLFGRISSFAENSTYAYFNKLYHTDNWLKSHFEEVVHSEGIYSLVYYKKI